MYDRLTATDITDGYRQAATRNPALIDALYAMGKDKVDDMVATFCADNMVSVNDLVGKCRVKPLVEKRHDCIAMLYRKLGLSYTMLGKIMGGRDHTTIINAIRRSDERAGK